MASEKDVDVHAVSQAEEAAPPSLKSSVFAWVLPALKSRRTIKTTIRCCLVTASTMVLLVDNKTLNSMGQAGFFASCVSFYMSRRTWASMNWWTDRLVSVMLPPTLALSLFVFVSITLLLGEPFMQWCDCTVQFTPKPVISRYAYRLGMGLCGYGFWTSR